MGTFKALGLCLVSAVIGCAPGAKHETSTEGQTLDPCFSIAGLPYDAVAGEAFLDAAIAGELCAAEVGAATDGALWAGAHARLEQLGADVDLMYVGPATYLKVLAMSDLGGDGGALAATLAMLGQLDVAPAEDAVAGGGDVVGGLSRGQLERLGRATRIAFDAEVARGGRRGLLPPSACETRYLLTRDVLGLSVDAYSTFADANCMPADRAEALLFLGYSALPSRFGESQAMTAAGHFMSDCERPNESARSGCDDYLRTAAERGRRAVRDHVHRQALHAMLAFSDQPATGLVMSVDLDGDRPTTWDADGVVQTSDWVGGSLTEDLSGRPPLAFVAPGTPNEGAIQAMLRRASSLYNDWLALHPTCVGDGCLHVMGAARPGRILDDVLPNPEWTDRVIPRVIVVLRVPYAAVITADGVPLRSIYEPVAPATAGLRGLDTADALIGRWFDMASFGADVYREDMLDVAGRVPDGDIRNLVIVR